jgi:ribonuclease HI
LNTYVIHFDGSCGPTNPGGTAAYGFTFHANGELTHSESGVLGTGEGMTNNYAEFMALNKALEYAWWHIPPHDRAVFLNVFGDSQFAINMMKGKWKGSEGKPYYLPMMECIGWSKKLRSRKTVVDYQWIPRARNEQCDTLSKAHYETKKPRLTNKKK